MRSSENAGKIDLNAEMRLWARAGHIKARLGKGGDIWKLDHLTSHAVLNG